MDAGFFEHLKPADYREIRMFAVQFLYQQDINQQLALQNSILETFFRQHNVAENYRKFLQQFLKEVFERTPQIDALVEKNSKNWKLSRIARVDLAILRIAVGELLLRPTTDIEVIISEAMRIASHFGAENSCAFINGILDPIAKAIRATP